MGQFVSFFDVPKDEGSQDLLSHNAKVASPLINDDGVTGDTAWMDEVDEDREKDVTADTAPKKESLDADGWMACMTSMDNVLDGRPSIQRKKKKKRNKDGKSMASMNKTHLKKTETEREQGGYQGNWMKSNDDHFAVITGPQKSGRKEADPFVNFGSLR